VAGAGEGGHDLRVDELATDHGFFSRVKFG
jgi:hypothetical protein